MKGDWHGKKDGQVSKGAYFDLPAGEEPDVGTRKSQSSAGVVSCQGNCEIWSDGIDGAVAERKWSLCNVRVGKSSTAYNSKMDL